MRTLRVITFNAGTLFEPQWTQRVPRLAAALVELQPDVVCLQEVAESSTRPNAARQVVDAVAESGGALTNMVYGGLPVRDGLFPDEPDLRFGSAVLSPHPVEAVATHALPVEPGDDGVTVVGWELLHARVAGLDVFSTHLCPAPRDARHRRLQVREIDRIITASRPAADRDPWDPQRPVMPAILCGDFNAEPDSDEIRFLCGLTSLDGVDTFYQDAWRVAGTGGPGYTNDWANPFLEVLNAHRKRIDYVFIGDPFVRQDGAGRIVDARIVLDEVVDAVPLSDHWGVLADVVWPGPADG